MAANNNIFKMSNAGGFKSLNRYYDMLAGNTVWNPWEPAGAYESIVALNFASAAAGFDFVNIPQTYQHLELRFMAYSTLSASVDNLAMYANNDTSSVYSTHSLSGNGSTTTSNAFTTQPRIYLPSLLSANTTAQYTVGIIQILDYTSTSKFKTTRTLHGYDANGSGIVGLSSGLYQSTNAITRFSGGTSANIAAGSQFALYGIKG
jgi:hypothetical protein